MFGGLVLIVALLLPRGILPSISDRLVRRAETGTASPTGSRLLESDLAATPVSHRVSVTPSASAALLHVRDVTMRFGGLTALDGASLAVASGSVTALIGPNGSGKTTLFNVIDGTYAASSGEVLLAGRSLGRLNRTRRAFAGVARTYQIPRRCPSLTVLENVAAVNREFTLSRLARSAVSGEEAARATELLDFVGMGEYLSIRATALSYGQRKLVELAQMLMLDPAVILLDEPAAGINPTLLRRLGRLIRALNQAGRTIVVVEHDMHFVLSLADHAVVLARGQVIAAGDPQTVSTDPAVLDAYLGDDFVLEIQQTGS